MFDSAHRTLHIYKRTWRIKITWIISQKRKIFMEFNGIFDWIYKSNIWLHVVPYLNILRCFSKYFTSEWSYFFPLKIKWNDLKIIGMKKFVWASGTKSLFYRFATFMTGNRKEKNFFHFVQFRSSIFFLFRKLL